MLSNISKVERRSRFVIGSLIWVLYWFGFITGGAAHVLAVLAVIFIATAIMNFCPYYLIFQLFTDKDTLA
ncbi:MAG: DUF2892 domain-containing protein [Gammaproteobacteria bacterium]|nr:DUF2892 domain-containing protein [Gammaproteobacteria bacterium]